MGYNDSIDLEWELDSMDTCASIYLYLSRDMISRAHLM